MRNLFLDPIAWAEKYFYFDSSSTYQGLWRLARAPWLRDVMLAFANPRVRSGTCRCSAQSAKTQTGMILALWSVCEDPGPFLWVMPAKDEAKTFSETRLQESMEACEPVQGLKTAGRWDMSSLEMHFVTAPLLLTGAGSPSKISGKPIRYLFLDEEKDMRKGAVAKALKRVRSKWDCKVWRMSTPKKEDDSIDLAFQDGDQCYWHVECPLCQEAHPLDWDYMRYDATGLNIRDIWYECPNPACQHQWRDIPQDRDWINNRGAWVAHNENADPGDKSWTWNALLPVWVSWRDIVSEWLKACAAAEIGDKEPLRIFWNETACRPGNYRNTKAEKDLVRLSGTYSVRDYATRGTRIENEHIRFATIDRGKGHWWLLVRAWTLKGSSKLLFYEQIGTYEKLKETLANCEVVPHLTFYDAGYEKLQVLRECCENGWIAVHGLPNVDSFVHKVRGLGGKIIREERKLFSVFEYYSVGKGLPPVRLINLATNRLKDITAHLRSGQGRSWEIPEDIGGIYLHQLVREAREEVRDPRTGALKLAWQQGVKGNHAWDCEVYQTAAAMMAGILGATDPKPASV
jgi:phage terminase large subunit GpA-like protein